MGKIFVIVIGEWFKFVVFVSMNVVDENFEDGFFGFLFEVVVVKGNVNVGLEGVIKCLCYYVSKKLIVRVGNIFLYGL